MSDTGLFRGEGGAVYEMALPLSPVYAEQVDKGLLVPVEPEPEPVPARRRSKKEAE